MIRRFSTLYVGHIELDHCGLSGTPADERRYPNPRLTEVFDTAIALAHATSGCASTRRKRRPSGGHAPPSRSTRSFMAPLGMLRYSEEHVSAVAARQA